MTPRHLATILVWALAMGACTLTPTSVVPTPELPDPPDAVDPEHVATHVTCGSAAFPAELLNAEGGDENGDHPAAASLRRLAESPEAADLLPLSGWRLVVSDDDLAVFIADAPPGSEPPIVEATFELVGDSWRMVGFGQCWPMSDVGPGLGRAEFRVAPGADLTPETTEVDVLVTERGCNSGEDAQGRIVRPAIIAGAESITVVFAVVPRGGLQACPGNPETPFALVLPEPLGDRPILDGSSIPPRDANTCPAIATCLPP